MAPPTSLQPLAAPYRRPRRPWPPFVWWTRQIAQFLQILLISCRLSCPLCQPACPARQQLALIQKVAGVATAALLRSTHSPNQHRQLKVQNAAAISAMILQNGRGAIEAPGEATIPAWMLKKPRQYRGLTRTLSRPCCIKPPPSRLSKSKFSTTGTPAWSTVETVSDPVSLKKSMLNCRLIFKSW